jgi:hypothetical protein
MEIRVLLAIIESIQNSETFQMWAHHLTQRLPTLRTTVPSSLQLLTRQRLKQRASDGCITPGALCYRQVRNARVALVANDQASISHIAQVNRYHRCTAAA